MTPMGDPPRQLAASPTHPWYDRGWARAAAVLIDGVEAERVLVANADEGWAEVVAKPYRVSMESSRPVTKVVRGDVRIVRKGAPVA